MRIGIAALAAAAAFGGPVAHAQQPAYLAASCANCHGTDGRSAGGMPTLAGIDAQYFVEQMSHFKSGRRIGTLMNQIAKGYTDDQIAVLARFFAGQKP